MRKLFLITLMAASLVGCGTAAKESGFWQHDTMYKNWDHMRYSWHGYKKPTYETGKQSQEQDWWGKPIPTKTLERDEGEH